MRARKVVKSTFTDYRDIIAFSSGNRIHLEGFFFRFTRLAAITDG